MEIPQSSRVRQAPQGMEIPRGWGSKAKVPPFGGGVWIFSGTTQSTSSTVVVGGINPALRLQKLESSFDYFEPYKQDQHHHVLRPFYDNFTLPNGKFEKT